VVAEWQADRVCIECENPFQIYVMNADGSNSRRISKEKTEDSNPAWAPDGAAIAYVAEGEAGHRAIYIMAADGSDAHRLVFSKKQDFCFPAWSRDGKFLAFTVLTALVPRPSSQEKKNHAVRCGPVNIKSSPSIAMARLTRSVTPS
jgi:Tol biopolymer transport system component